MPAAEHALRRWLPRLLGLLLALVGAALAIGGARLATLGGPVYHLLAGVALLASGALLAMRRPAGVWVYLALFAVTVVWALLRAGLNGWALIPWLVAPTVLLVLVLLVAPAVVRGRRAVALAAAGALIAIGLPATLVVAAREPVVRPAPGPAAPAAASADWPAYGGARGGGQFSAASGIAPGNVHRLRKVWTFRTGEVGAGLARPDKLTFEANPVVVDGRLYAATALDEAFALDAVSGRLLWRYDPRIARATRFGEVASRGVSLWTDAAAATSSPCRRRVFLGTLDARLIALDAANGRPCAGFGAGGTVDLGRGVGPRGVGTYYVTSPPAIVGDVVVVGSGIGDNRATELERGIVRGFDTRTGRRLWTWDPIPSTSAGARALGWRPEQAVRTGAANAWAPLSSDERRGLVFVPTGSASPDYWGGKRLGPNADANSVVALRAADGAVVWRRQLVRHDLWDYDVSAQPALATIRAGGRSRDVVVAANKAGFVFVLDRDTGAPLVPVEERAVPRSDVAGEAAAPTQPFPPPAFRVARHAPLRAGDAWGFTPLDQLSCAIRIARLRSEGVYTPPSVRGSVAFPGYGGGLNWGGIAYDPGRRLAIIPVMDVAMAATLIPRAPVDRWRAMRDSGDYDASEFAAMAGTPFGLQREPLSSPLGAPCSPPPWGRLVALDLAAGRVAWDRPLGTTGEISPTALPLGSPLLGGAVATGGGVTFVGASTDAMLRAFDTATGRLLWQDKLPAGAQSTPSLFTAGGNSFLVVAAGGSGKLGGRTSDTLVAYTLDPAPR